MECTQIQGLKNKCEIIIKDLEKLKYDIIITETKKKIVNWKWLDWFIHFYSRVLKKKRAEKKVSIILKKKLSRNVTHGKSYRWKFDQSEFKLDAEKNNNYSGKRSIWRSKQWIILHQT